jgi:cytoplasmic iron level regulating protein YaaA (DUF328/UPF0246 family)
MSNSIIITCGSKKSITPSRAELMYLGSHFKRCLSWAKSKSSQDKIFILSAKYGLLKLDQKINPYDLRMGQEGCVDFNFVKNQAIELNIIDNQIYSTAGKEYRNILDQVFKNIKYPFFNMSMGYMAQAIKRDMDGK